MRKIIVVILVLIIIFFLGVNEIILDYFFTPLLDDEITFSVGAIIGLCALIILIVFGIIHYKEKLSSIFADVSYKELYEQQIQCQTNSTVTKELQTTQQKSINPFQDIVGRKFNLKKIISQYFPSYSDYALVQFGSFDQISPPPRDNDFLVMLIGVPSSIEKRRLSLGEIPRPSSPKVDLEFCDYVSALSYLTVGDPLYHNIASNCKYLYGPEYLVSLFQRIAFHVEIPKNDLVKHLNNKLQYEISLWNSIPKKAPPFIYVLRTYWFMTTKAQLEIISHIDLEYFQHNAIIEYCEPKKLPSYIENNAKRDIFMEIVDLYKGSEEKINVKRVKRIREIYLKE